MSDTNGRRKLASNGRRKLTSNDLSAEACYALVYAQAMTTPEGSFARRSLERGVADLDRKRVSAADRRRALARGLAELRELGVVDCERDGDGDLVPTAVHGERIDPAAARVILGDAE
jgi:hypothetical protein